MCDRSGGAGILLRVWQPPLDVASRPPKSSSFKRTPQVAPLIPEKSLTQQILTEGLLCARHMGSSSDHMGHEHCSPRRGVRRQTSNIRNKLVDVYECPEAPITKVHPLGPHSRDICSLNHGAGRATSLWTLERKIHPRPFAQLGVLGALWLVDTSLQALPLPPTASPVHLCVPIFLGDTCHWIKAHSKNLILT